jgi:hypothetical protein
VRKSLGKLKRWKAKVKLSWRRTTPCRRVGKWRNTIIKLT